MKRFIVGCSLILAITGCTISSGNPNAEDQTRVEQIRVGKSSKSEVKRLLGEPTSIEFPSASTELWFYNSARAHISPLVAIPFFGLFSNGGGYSEQSQVFVEFSTRGIVKKVSTNYDKTDSRSLLD